MSLLKPEKRLLKVKYRTHFLERDEFKDDHDYLYIYGNSIEEIEEMLRKFYKNLSMDETQIDFSYRSFQEIPTITDGLIEDLKQQREAFKKSK